MMNFKHCPKAAILFTSLLLSTGLVTPPAMAAGSAGYRPGVLIVPEVLRPDGVITEMFNTGQGMSLWTPGLPIPIGDKVKLSIFAATGGADLKDIRVKVDHSLVADITRAPWNVVVDTSKLGRGYHLVEAVAVPTGKNPDSLPQTLSFTVGPAIQVGGYQGSLGANGQTIENPLPTGVAGVGPETFSDALPQLPDYLKAQAQDANATVTVAARSAASSEQAGGAAISDAPVTVNEPTLFIVQPAPGSTATRYAYALVRGGDTVSTSPQVLRTAYDRIRIERRTDTQAGLRPGKVTMWIWGIDKQGNYSSPVKTYLDIPTDN